MPALSFSVGASSFRATVRFSAVVAPGTTSAAAKINHLIMSVARLHGCGPKRIRDDRHRRGFVQDGQGSSLGRTRLDCLVTMVSQDNGADPKPVLDLNSCSDAVHLTFKI